MSVADSGCLSRIRHMNFFHPGPASKNLRIPGNTDRNYFNRHWFIGRPPPPIPLCHSLQSLFCITVRAGNQLSTSYPRKLILEASSSTLGTDTMLFMEKKPSQELENREGWPSQNKCKHLIVLIDNWQGKIQTSRHRYVLSRRINFIALPTRMSP